MTPDLKPFLVTLKWGQRRQIKAVDLRDAQDRALEIFGPFTVIMVTEARQTPEG